MGSLELMGWAGSAYQYGILATHWYWIGAIPAMLFLGLVMMPFYYVSKTHSVPGYLKLRFGESSRILAAFSFAIEMILMSGVNMFSMAVVMKVVLGWNITFSILMSSLAVAVYVGLGGSALRHLQRGAAICVDLGWRAAGSRARPGGGGWLAPDGGQDRQRIIGIRITCICGAIRRTLAATRWECIGRALSLGWAVSSPLATGRRIFW